MTRRWRTGITLLMGLAFLAAACSLAFAKVEAPKADLTIESKDVFKKKKKITVPFSHTKHKANDCTVCHHDYKDGKNVWKKGQEVKKCGACHLLKKEGKVVKLKDAFHKQCKGCHKELKKAKKPTGPTGCVKCHPKK